MMMGHVTISIPSIQNIIACTKTTRPLTTATQLTFLFITEIQYSGNPVFWCLHHTTWISHLFGYTTVKLELAFWLCECDHTTITIHPSIPYLWLIATFFIWNMSIIGVLPQIDSKCGRNYTTAFHRKQFLLSTFKKEEKNSTPTFFCVL